MLCNECFKPFRGEKPPNYKEAFTADWTQGILEAVPDCYICLRIWRHIASEQQNDASIPPNQYTVVRDLQNEEYSSHDELWKIYSIRIEKSEHLGDADVERVLNRSPDEPRIVENRTDSETTIGLARQWIQRCVTSHEDCHKDLTKTKMPTRLLKLTTESVQLCITDISQPRFPYMTLSHCWGSVQLLRLTAETSNNLFSGYPVQKLPQTFQNAVSVALRLGTHFLWIDSLCIFQDSEKDWQAEAASMADVYRGSLCNIAATASDNSRGGLFRTRDPRYIPSCRITTRYTDHANDTYDMIEFGPGLDHYIQQNLYSGLPLLGRGWVVQERLLPPRILHFGESQVFWECHEDVCSETYPGGISIHVDRLLSYSPILKMKDPSAKALLAPRDLLNSSELKVLIYEFWEATVAFYTRCNLTNEGDKLVAISGMAKEISSYLGGKDKYMTGVWRDDLFAQLAWHSDFNIKDNRNLVLRRPKSYRAPSWSWASVDGPITLGSSHYLEYWRDFSNTVVAFAIETSTGDDFGQVTGGRIRISGFLKTLTCIHNSNPSSQNPEFRCKLKTKHWYEQGATQGAPQVFWDIANDPEETSLVDGNKNSLRLHWMPFFPRDSKAQTSHVLGLILQPTGKARGEFKRLGLMDVMGSQMPGSQDVSQLADPDPQDSWLEYEEFDGTAYTVSII